MSQTPLLANGARPSVPITGTTIGYDPTASGSPVSTVQDELDRLEALVASSPSGAFLTSNYGEQAQVVTSSAAGAAYTIDCSLGNTFDLTLTANCTLTISNPAPAGVDSHIVIILRQGGTGSYTVTWPASVVWQDPADGTTGGSAPTLWTAVGAQNTVELSTLDGGTTWGGDAGVSQFNLTVKDEGAPLATGATSLDFVGAGVVASGATAAKTITISGAPTGAAGGDLSGTYPNPTLNAAAVAALVGSEHVHVAYETHTSDGSTVTFTLDQVYEPNSVMAWNRTAGTLLGITEVLPDQATISAAGTAADLLDFHYAASVI